MKSRSVIYFLLSALALFSFSGEPCDIQINVEQNGNILPPQEFLDSLRIVCSDSDSISWCNALDLAGNSLYYEYNFEAAAAYYQLSLFLREQIHKREPRRADNLEGIVKANANLGNFYQRLGYFNRAMRHIRASLDSLKAFRNRGLYYDSYREGRAYHALGQVFVEIEGPEETKFAYLNAIVYFRDSLYMPKERTALDRNRNIAKVYNDLSDLSVRWEEPDSAIHYANKAIQLYKSIYREYKRQLQVQKSPKELKDLQERIARLMGDDLARSLRNRAAALEIDGRYEQSVLVYDTVRFIYRSLLKPGFSEQQKAFDAVIGGQAQLEGGLIKTISAPISPVYIELIDLNILQAIPLMELNRMDMSEAMLRTALQINEQLMQLEGGDNYLHRISKAACWINLGELFHRKGDYATNLRLQDSALDILDTTMHNGETFYLNEQYVLGALHLRAKAELAMGDAESASKTAKKAWSIIEKMQNEYQDTASKVKLRQVNQKVFDIAIKANLALSQAEKAFEYAEQNKGFVMKENIRKYNIISGVADSLLERERKLEYDINEYKVGVIEYGDPAYYQEMQKLMGELQKLRDSLYEYPNYQKAFAATAPEELSPSKLSKKLLGRQQALIEYHVGEETTIIFLVQDGKVDFCEAVYLSRESIRSLEKALYDGIYTRHIKKTELNKLIYQAMDINKGKIDSLELEVNRLDAQYIETAKLLYDSLFAPIEPYLKSKRVILIPDDALSRIPFGALLTAVPSTEMIGQFINYSFLVKDYEFSYGYSTIILNEMKKNKAEGDGLIVVTPSFGNSSAGTKTEETPLAHIGIKPDIKENYKGLVKVLPDSAADKSSFLNEIDSVDYRYAMLITHAVIDEKNPGRSYISFTQSDSLDANQVLYWKELSGLRLPFEIVYLFACNTNRGAIVPGEGIMSFARGLSMAGVKNIMASFWNVRITERTIKQLPEELIANLNTEGNSPVSALRNAQIDMLKEEVFADPYYWAAFAFIGHSDAPERMPAGTPGKKILFFAGAVIILLLLFFLFRKRSAG